jgi:dUTP pyrophosphatase
MDTDVEQQQNNMDTDFEQSATAVNTVPEQFTTLATVPHDPPTTITTGPEVLYRLTKAAQFYPVLRDNSNGFDLPLQNDLHLEPFTILKVNLGVCIQFPPNFCGLLINKSSAITLFKTKVYLGLIDHGYTKELQAVIQNISQHPQFLPAGLAIAQLLVIPAPIPKFTMCLADKLPKETERGGFGSTGQHFERVLPSF